MVKMIACEVYKRVVGYYRPISQVNPGKVEELKERKVLSQESFKL